MKPLCLFAVLAICAGQTSAPVAIVVNGATAAWTKESGGSESIALREDPTEMLVRYPAGHKFAPHWHTANERMVLLEGRMSIGKSGSEKFIDPGGYAFLPAREVQYMECVSKTRCAFYVFWDSKLDFHTP